MTVPFGQEAWRVDFWTGEQEDRTGVGRRCPPEQNGSAMMKGHTDVELFCSKAKPRSVRAGAAEAGGIKKEGQLC